MLVIFDCDGVLVDSEPVGNRELAAMITELGAPTTMEESMALFMGRSWDTIVPLIEDRAGVPVPPDFVDRYYERIFECFERELQPVPGIEQALEAIQREHPTCVASSGSHQKIRRALSVTGLLPRFPDERIFSAHDLRRGKPAPDLFLAACHSMGHRPAGALVVEDAPPGVAAARAAGMTALGYRTEADVTFTDMRDLPALIRDSARG